MATVTVNELECGVTYTIIAGGILNNGTLVGTSSFHGTIREECQSRADDDDNNGKIESAMSVHVHTYM